MSDKHDIEVMLGLARAAQMHARRDSVSFKAWHHGMKAYLFRSLLGGIRYTPPFAGAIKLPQISSASASRQTKSGVSFLLASLIYPGQDTILIDMSSSLPASPDQLNNAEFIRARPKCRTRDPDAHGICEARITVDIFSSCCSGPFSWNQTAFDGFELGLDVGY